MIHVFQVHKESIDAVPHAKKGRDSFELEIFGMVGVPQELVQERLVKLYGEPAAKKQKIDHAPRQGGVMMPGMGSAQPPYRQQNQPMMGRGMPPPQFGMPPQGFMPNQRPGPGHMPPPHMMQNPYGNQMPPHQQQHGMMPPHQQHGGQRGPPNPNMPPPHQQHHPGMPPSHHPGGPHGGPPNPNMPPHHQRPPPHGHPGMMPPNHHPGGMMPPQQAGMMPPQIQQQPISNDAKIDVVERSDHLVQQSSMAKKSTKKKIVRIYDRPGISMEEMRASHPKYSNALSA